MTLDRRAIALALFPLVVTLIAVMATAAFGLSIPRIEALIDRPNVQFGYFAEQFPLLAYGVIYTLARLMVVTMTAGKPWAFFRPILWVAAAVVVLAAASFPNFGGVIARAGFALGGISLISAIPPGLQWAFGGAIAGSMLALLTGLGHIIVDWQWKPSFGKVFRGFFALVGWMVMGAAIGTLWPAIVAAGGYFPKGPMGLLEAVGICGVLIIASALHVVVSAFTVAARWPRQVTTPVATRL